MLRGLPSTLVLGQLWKFMSFKDHVMERDSHYLPAFCNKQLIR